VRELGALTNLNSLTVEEGATSWNLRDKTNMQEHEEAFVGRRVLANTQLTSLNSITGGTAGENGTRWDLREALAHASYEAFFVGNTLKFTLSSLTSLDVSVNSLHDISASKAILHNLPSTLKQLNISQCSLGSQGVFALAAILPSAGSQSLTDLDLSQNYCGEKGAEAIAATLSCLGSLTRLVMSGNEVMARGCAAIGAAIEADPTTLSAKLQTLDLSDNMAGAAGVEALAAPLSKAKALKYINLSDNGIPKENAAAVELEKGKKAGGCIVKLEDKKPRPPRMAMPVAGSPSRAQREEGAWSRSPDRVNDRTATLFHEKAPDAVEVPPTDQKKPKFAVSPSKK